SEKIKLQRLLADLALQLGDALGRDIVGSAVLPLRRASHLARRCARLRSLRPGRRSPRPAGSAQCLWAAALVPVPPVVQDLGPYLALARQGSHLLPVHDPAYGSFLELPAEVTGSLAGHRSSPRGLSPISLSHRKGSLHLFQ